MAVSEIGAPASGPAFSFNGANNAAVLTFLYEQSGTEPVIPSNKNEEHELQKDDIRLPSRQIQ